MYLITNKKLPRSGISYVKSAKKAQELARKAEERSGKKPYIYKISAPKKR